MKYKRYYMNMTTFDSIPSKDTIDQTIQALTDNGINAVYAETPEEAKQKVLELIPKGAEVMTMSSETVRSLGLDTVFNESGEYDSVRAKLMKMNRETQGREMQKLGAAPDYTLGSVHAVTQDGKVLIASNTGSQLPAYVYASAHVVWVVGAQKIVADIAEGERRIYEYILPKETVRLGKQYGNPNLKSNVSKLLIVNKEVNPKRITLILINQSLGF